MSIFQAVWTDIPALVRDTLALIATAPTEALRLLPDVMAYREIVDRVAADIAKCEAAWKTM